LPVDQVDDEQSSANRQCDGDFDHRHRCIDLADLKFNSVEEFEQKLEAYKLQETSFREVLAA
jgi:hypothetical protein